MTKAELDQLKNRSRNWSVDMSPQAILKRLDTLDELNRLCEWLGKSKPIQPDNQDATQQIKQNAAIKKKGRSGRP
jgi:hypothetical protein